MKLRLSKHAKQKIDERKVRVEDIKEVVKDAEIVFYDIDSKAFVSIGKIVFEGVETNLVVVYKKEKEAIKIITVYPCRDIEKETKRKEVKRWIRIR